MAGCYFRVVNSGWPPGGAGKRDGVTGRRPQSVFGDTGFLGSVAKLIVLAEIDDL
jgi:hypothetical protein